jgi:hypothetical protein
VTNSDIDIVGSFIGCLAKAKAEKWAIVRLCYNVFNPMWSVGLEEVVNSIDDKLRIPLPEQYMAHPPGSFELTIVPRRPVGSQNRRLESYEPCVKNIT